MGRGGSTGSLGRTEKVQDRALLWKKAAENCWLAVIKLLFLLGADGETAL